MLTIIETLNSTYEVHTSDVADVLSIRRTFGNSPTVLPAPDGRWVTVKANGRTPLAGIGNRIAFVQGVANGEPLIVTTSRIRRIYDRKPNGQREMSHFPGAFELLAPEVSPGFHLVAG